MADALGGIAFCAGIVATGTDQSGGVGELWEGRRLDRGPRDLSGPRLGAASVGRPRDCRSQGLGRALVSDFEEQVRLRRGSTIYLGTDDENDRTSLGGVDLYPDSLAAAAQIQSVGRHSFDFYRKVGFVIVGVLPDANGSSWRQGPRGAPAEPQEQRVPLGVSRLQLSGLTGPEEPGHGRRDLARVSGEGRRPRAPGALTGGPQPRLGGPAARFAPRPGRGGPFPPSSDQTLQDVCDTLAQRDHRQASPRLGTRGGR